MDEEYIVYMDEEYIVYKDGEQIAQYRTLKGATNRADKIGGSVYQGGECIYANEIPTTKRGKLNVNMNVRSGPSLSAAKLAVYKAGTEIDILEDCGDWYKIEHDGSAAYITNKGGKYITLI